MVVDFDTIGQNLRRRNYYPFLGSGSGRLVFDLNNGYVVKVAKNRKGIAQNRAEYQISTAEHSDLFAKIFAVSEDYHYLIMQKAERVDSISEVWRYFEVNNNRELSRLDIFVKITEKHNLLMNDLYRKMNWGFIHGRPVIIDYGFTKETRKLYRF